LFRPGHFSVFVEDYIKINSRITNFHFEDYNRIAKIESFLNFSHKLEYIGIKFYWSWARGTVLIMRTVCCSRNVLCFTGLGPQDWCSSRGQLVVPETCYVLLVLGRRTGTHREDCLLFQKRVIDEDQSSGPRPVKHSTFLEQQTVLTMSTSPPAQDQ
jgi:hypothetical protein